MAPYLPSNGSRNLQLGPTVVHTREYFACPRTEWDALPEIHLTAKAAVQMMNAAPTAAAPSIVSSDPPVCAIYQWQQTRSIDKLGFQTLSMVRH